MSKAEFFDSNVLLYVLSASATKADAVEKLLDGGGTISVQVLNEFAAVSTGKFRMPMATIRRALTDIRDACTVVPLDIATHEQGLDIADRYKFSIYDSMLLAAALQAGCTTFYSEDMSHGQKIGGLTIRNPFRP